MCKESEKAIQEYTLKTDKAKSMLQTENTQYEYLKSDADSIKNDYNTKERRHILILNQLSSFKNQCQELSAQINTLLAHRSITNQCQNVIRQKINEQKSMKIYFNKKLSYFGNLITHQTKINEENNIISAAVQKKQEAVDKLLREV